MTGETLRSARSRAAGFTLLELIIVMAIIGILATIALPQLINHPRRAKEVVLKTNLRTMRDSLDQYYADKGRYPAGLVALEEEGYLRKVPIDPITNSADTWIEVFAEYNEDDLSDLPDDDDSGEPGVEDVHSGSDEISLDGEPYSDW